jgi:hypothetical protein
MSVSRLPGRAADRGRRLRRLYREEVVRNRHLAALVDPRHPSQVSELPLDRGDVTTIMESLFDLNRKADLILALLGGDDEEEEEDLGDS